MLLLFAVASGVSPEKGLVTGLVAGFLISFLGGSRVQIGGLIISTVMSGVILVIFGLLRLGTLLKYLTKGPKFV